MDYKLFGIPNCDTVKKARAYFDRKKIKYEFVDFKKQPPTPELLKKWKQALGDFPTNPKGPTFKKIKEQFDAASEAEKIKLLIEFSSAIKRPIIEANETLATVGFDEKIFSDKIK